MTLHVGKIWLVVATIGVATLACAAEVKPPASPTVPYAGSGMPVSAREVTLTAPFNDANREWTLPELLDEALKRNPSTAQAWQQANALAAQLGVQKALNYPTISVGVQGGGLYLKLLFVDGKSVILPYGDIIHLRRHFATGELLGSDNAPLYPLIDTAHTLTEATAAAVKNATNIRGILKFTSLVNPAQVKLEKETFVRDYMNTSNAGGIAATDQRFEFVPTHTAAYNVPHEQIDAVNRQICAYLGISPKIVSGDYTEDEFAAFYESVIEPFALQMSLEFSRKCSADITFTAERLEFASAKTRISLLRELLPFGVLSINEARKLLALPEVEDGNKRLQSLNFANTQIVDDYQTESEVQDK
jgi:hypothetical protein